MSKFWVERKIIFDEQEVVITPGDGDGEIEIEIGVTGEESKITLFVTFAEARMLARQILDYCEMEEQIQQHE